VTVPPLSQRAAKLSRAARRQDSLYVPLGWGVVRAPTLPVSSMVADGALDQSSSVSDDPVVRAAILVASGNLHAALERRRDRARDSRDAARTRAKFLRYLIRMSTRPTPYGLFAGVGLLDWGDVTDLRIGSGPARTRTRPDMEWLLDLIAGLERDPAVRAEVRLVASSAVVFRGGRALMTVGSAAPVSVRATGAVRQTLELARVPISMKALVERLGTVPGATPEKAQRLVDDLWRQGFLLSDLRPPLTGGDPSSHLRERLAAIPATRPIAEELGSLLDALAEWDRLPLDERSGAWSHLLDRARAVHPGAKPKNALQTDLALPLTGTRVHAAVGIEAARAAELLLRLSPFHGGPPHLERYRLAFEGRYGRDRWVPLLELLDPDVGLGPPDTTADPGSDPRADPRRQRLLCELAIGALRDHRLAIELDDKLLDQLAIWKPGTTPCPSSLDVPIFVAASSSQAIDAGAFQVIVGPAVATAAGRIVGRFADLLEPAARLALEAAADVESSLEPHCVQAEVVYPSQRARSANVAIRPSVRTYEIVIDTLPGVPDDRVVPLDQLAVGLCDGRLAVRWPARDVEVTGTQGHMLNHAGAPPVARFLLEVASSGRCQIAPFQWGAATAFPFVPRVQRGRIVLSLAQWRIDATLGGLLAPAAGGFADALARWRERWMVPRCIYLAEGDRRLLLDLERPEHVALLADDLRVRRGGNTVLVQEALPGPSDAWLPGARGVHLCELVVPIALRRPNAPVSLPDPTHPDDRPAPARVRLRPPGSDWLYLKLYSPQSFEADLIAGPLREFADLVIGRDLSDGWFFVRYTDPDPHLRLRFHGDPDVLLGRLLPEICEWASDLVADATCTRFAIDTYEREVERYGGEDGMRVAERLFAVDSSIVAQMLQLSRSGQMLLDMTNLAVVSVDDLLDALGVNAEQRVELYRESTVTRPDDGEAYRSRKNELREILGRPSVLADQHGPLAALLGARRAAMAPIAAELSSLERDNRLYRSRAQLLRAYVHMHANRLLGTDARSEQLTLRLLRRTRVGLLRHASSTMQLPPQNGGSD